MNKLCKVLSVFLFIQSALMSSFVSAIDLDERLTEWANANPVITVGADAGFPPFDFVDEQGNTSGLGEAARQKLSEILPINLKVVSSTTFEKEYSSLLNGEIDAISICAEIKSRKDEVLFSKPIINIAPILIVNNQFTQIKTFKNFTNEHTLGVTKGYATVGYATELREDLNFIEFPSNLEGYKKVESGEVDAFITYLYVYEHLVKTQGFKNLSPVALPQLKGYDVGFCINKSKPELVEILNKGIDQLGSNYITALQGHWTVANTNIIDDAVINVDYKHLIIYSALSVIIILLTVIFIARKFASEIATRIDTARFRVIYFFSLVAIFLLLFILKNIYLEEFKQEIESDTKDSFAITKEVTDVAVNDWYEQRKQITIEVAQLSSFKHLVAQLVIAHDQKNKNELEKIKVQLRKFFDDRPFTTIDRRAYTISNTEGAYLLNAVESAENRLGAIKRVRPDLFSKVLAGNTQFIPPIWSDVDIDGNSSDEDQEIFIAVPIYNNKNEVIAVFAMRFDPHGRYSRLFNDIRLGKTFETYAVNENGYIVSESRFIKELQQQRQISFDESSILNIQLPSPESNPIVHAAQFKLDGQNMDGYVGYRGQKVVGRWSWFEDLNFLVVSEIDYAEIYNEYYELRDLLFVGLVIVAILVLSLSIFIITIAKRSNEINNRSKEELANLVEERTKELNYSEHKNKLIFSSVADGIIGVDKDDRVAFANQSVSKILDIPLEELLNQKLKDVFRTDNELINNTELSERTMYKELMKRKVLRIDHEDVYLPDGKCMPIEYSATVVEDEKSPLSIVLVFKDITQRLIEKERVENILNIAPVCMMIVNESDIIESMNDTGLKMFGYKREEILGQETSFIVPDSRKASHKEWVKEYWRDPTLLSKEKDGLQLDMQAKTHTFFAETINTFVEFESGMHVVVMIRDITIDNEVKQALIDAKKIADDASKAKSDFLANMSHEIRTPMNAIMGMSHLALGCELDRKPRNYISKVSKAAESLLGIINDILDFSKIEAGKLDLESIEFNLDDVLDNLSNIIGFKSDEKGLELLFDIAANVPKILIGDSLRLNQVLTNIAGNAVKFTEHGEIVIAISVKQFTEDNVELLFSIKDSGIGMSTEQKEKLFKSFSQADSSITRKYGGTGLGLTISKKLIELMHGNIWVESEYTQGSNFLFTSEFGLSKQANEVFLASRKTFLTDKRVLIVDDNGIALDVLKSILESFKCNVITAISGEEAIEIVNQSTIKFDFFLIDWKMPGLDGIETINIISEKNSYSSRDFILVTSSARDDLVLEELHGSIKSIIKKPVTASTVFDELMSIHGNEVNKSNRQESRIQSLIENQHKMANCKILLVEDNELNQELALQLLKDANVITDLAENGQQAVDKVALYEYDGVLMDLQMPIMDGISATKLIRKSHPDLPILAMTANAMAGDREKVIDVGMNDYIIKPINVSDMFSTMVKWIKPSKNNVLINHNQNLPVATENTLPIDTIEEELLFNFKYIDVDAGMAVCNGNKKLYLKLLEKFVSGQQSFSTLFSEAIKNNHIKDATRIAHTLKGSCGNIGAKILQEESGKLELICSENQLCDMENILDSVEQALQNVMSELKTYLAKSSLYNKNDKATLVKYEPSQELSNDLNQLLVLVEGFEADCIDIAAELSEKFKGTDKEKSFGKICDHLQSYEFTEGEDFLKRFIKDIEE